MKINEIEPNEFIIKIAEELKKKGIEAPEWAQFVKTGVHKERPPVEKDWWFMRVAAILRSVALLGPVGVSKLRTKYGGKQRRGHKPAKFARGSGNIIRKALQQLEKLNFIKQATVGSHKGRILTKEGKEFLNSIAGVSTVKKEKAAKPVKEEKPKKEKKETPEKKKPVKKEQEEKPEKAPVEKNQEKSEEVKE